MADYAAEKEPGYFLEVDESGHDVNGNRIQADNDKWKRPAPQFPHVDDQVEECQQEQTAAPGHQHIGAGPKNLDDGEHLAPGHADSQAGQTCPYQPDNLAPITRAE